MILFIPASLASLAGLDLLGGILLQISYVDRVRAEKLQYDACEEVHELPEIFHYWSNRYLKPQLESYGFSGPDDFFLKSLEKVAGETILVLSVGSGNCDLEVALASQLSRVRMDCLDLNPTMLDRGREQARKFGVEDRVRFLEEDFNQLTLEESYDVVIFNQSLHHVTELEVLLDEVKRKLKPGGKILLSEMIGRNGHVRWPVALHWIWQFWRELPPSYRYNRMYRCYEELYVDRDCSGVAFEGIRAEDILPLLLQRFEFEFFFGFGNVIDPFVDRVFGPNFDAGKTWDRDFVDRVHAKDQELIEAAEIPPTHMLAVLCHPGEATEKRQNLAPEECLKVRTKTQVATVRPESAYGFAIEELDPSREILSLAAIAVEYEEYCEVARGIISKVSDEVEQQSRWGLELKGQLEASETRVVALQHEVAERNQWALDTEGIVHRAEIELGSLRGEVAEWTTLAERLKQELDQRTAWALELDREIGDYKAHQAELVAELAEVAWLVKLRRGVGKFFT